MSEQRGLFDSIETMAGEQIDLVHPLDEEERKVFDVLKICLGKPCAVTRQKLAWYSGLDDRKCRAAIERLRKFHNLPVGSLISEPGGYYVCITEEEYRENFERELKRNRSGLRNLRVFARSQRLLQLLGQLELELGEEGTKAQRHKGTKEETAKEEGL